MFTHSLRSFLFVSLLSSLLGTSALQAQQAGAVRVTQAVDTSVRVTLPGNTHPLARAEFDRGEAPSDLPMKRMLLVLKRSPEQESALLSLLEDQYDKKSPSFHKWLTPVEFGASFGPADSDIAVVTNWLQTSGFQVAQVSKGRTVIEFYGTAGLVKQTFATAIHKFFVKGEEHWANIGDPSIPAALSPIVAGIDSLHNFPKKAQNHYIGQYSVQTKRLTSPNPDFTVGCGTSSTCYGVTPYDFATIYDLLPLWNAATPINGTGQTIAIVGQTDINPADATAFWNLFGLDGTHAPRPTLTITHNGPAPGVNGDEVEADIDTQWSGAAAPGATINFVTSASTETTAGIDLSAIYIVDNNLAPVMSESYGACERALGNGGVSFYGALWEQAAAQGITALVSAGDGGAAGCDNFNTSPAAQNGLGVSGLASTPFNVAVGGTDFNQFRTQATYWNASNNPITQESAKSYIPETTWNDSCTNGLLHFLTGGSTNAEANCNNPNFTIFHDIVGGSGGVSAAWLKPAWQTGAGVPNDNARDLPDVSLFASDGFLNSFYIICQMDRNNTPCSLSNLSGSGGTSVASPAFAGIMALVNQKWGPQGNANFVLYRLPAKQPNAFHDIPAGTTIAVPCLTGTLNCTTSTGGDAYGILSGYNTTTAYDLATGLGSVDAANLVNNWNKATFTPTTTTLTLGTATVTHGTAVPVTISVNPSAATGDAAILVNPVTPGNPGIDFFKLKSGTVNGMTKLLPGGTYKIIAHYAGDTTYGGSYSSPSASVTITAENSSVLMPGLVTGVNASGPVYSTSVPYGSPYLLRADVANAGGSLCTSGPGIACPTGSIAFTDNGGALDAGTYSLNSFAYTDDNAIQLSGGSHALIAKYSGDPSYKPSTTATTVAVTKAPITISNLSGQGFAQPGTFFSLSTSGTSTSSGVAPTGTVSLFVSGTPLASTKTFFGQPGPNASFTAVLNSSINTPGNYNITATYTGDGNYAGATTSASFPLSVYDFTTSVPANTLPVNPGQSTSTTITVSPVGIATFTNNVQFGGCSGPAGSTCTVSPSQIAAGSPATTVTITVQTAGPFTGIAAGARRKLLGRNRLPWMPLGLPLVGVVLLGLAGRRLPQRQQPITALCLGLLFVGILQACGGGGSSSGPPPPISVSVSPTTVNTLYPNITVNGVQAPAQTQQFRATVNNSTNQSVTWAVTGGSGNGTIDATGLYTAPPALPATSNVTVTATSTADAAKAGPAAVNLLTPTPAGTYSIFVTLAEGGLTKNSPTFNLTVN